jgi:hypothetical protein
MVQIEFQDTFFQLGRITTKYKEFFKMEHNTNRPYESKNRIHFMIRYEMNLN